MKEDIIVLVATHKIYHMPTESMYRPIQVGAIGKDDFGYLRDDMGIHISEKNSNYCELTAIYWAWKNIKTDYIGLCHYRRYFSNLSSFFFAGTIYDALSKEECKKILKSYDCIVPKKRNYYIETVASHYEHAHNRDDLEALKKIVEESFPSYVEAWDKVMNGRRLHLYNMFIMKWDDFDEYCQFVFACLDRLEEKIDISLYSDYEARVYGFLTERLFNVWLVHKGLKIKELNVINLEPINWRKKIWNFLKRKFNG